MVVEWVDAMAVAKAALSADAMVVDSAASLVASKVVLSAGAMDENLAVLLDSKLVGKRVLN